MQCIFKLATSRTSGVHYIYRECELTQQ